MRHHKLVTRTWSPHVLEYMREARAMASSDSDSSFTNDESNYEMENVYDSGSEAGEDVGEEQEVRGGCMSHRYG